MNIGEPRREIEIVPTTAPVPEVLPVTEPSPEAEPARRPEPQVPEPVPAGPPASRRR
jgi:hypothetical protein